MVSMTDEQFKQLLATMGAVNIKKGSFTGCTARFKGVNQTSKVEEFITVTTIYKDIEHISDQDALTGLPLLLEDGATTWWQGVKDTVQTYEAAMTLLRNTYAPKKPAFRIFQEIMENKQHQNTSTDIFLNEKRALFAQLSAVSKPTERIQLDLIYGLLHMDIRQAVSRDTINSFDMLIEKARAAENLMKERDNSKTDKPKNRDTRCAFCNIRGHTEDVCRKKQTLETAKTMAQQEIKKEIDEKKSIQCYGCGKPNVFRSNCSTCNKETKSTSANEIEFYSMNSKLGRNVPQVDVVINGMKGIAHIDTAARMSVASKMLYYKLKQANWPFNENMVNIRLADGSCRLQKTMVTSVNIQLGNKTMKIKMIALPEADDNRTLLGIDFLEEAKIVINTPQRAWSFADTPLKWYAYNTAVSEFPNELPHILKTKPDFNVTSYQPIKRKAEETIKFNEKQHVSTANNDTIIENLPPIGFVTPKRGKTFESAFIQLAEEKANTAQQQQQQQSSIKSFTPSLSPLIKKMTTIEKVLSPILSTPTSSSFRNMSSEPLVTPLPSMSSSSKNIFSTTITKPLNKNKMITPLVTPLPPMSSSSGKLFTTITKRETTPSPSTILASMKNSKLLSPLPSTPKGITLDLMAIDFELHMDEADHLNNNEKKKISNNVHNENKNIVTPYMKHFIKTKQKFPLTCTIDRPSPGKTDSFDIISAGQADKNQLKKFKNNFSNQTPGTLLQGERENKPIKYASCLLTPSEIYHSTTEKEPVADKFYHVYIGSAKAIITAVRDAMNSVKNQHRFFYSKPHFCKKASHTGNCIFRKFCTSNSTSIIKRGITTSATIAKKRQTYKNATANAGTSKFTVEGECTIYI